MERQSPAHDGEEYAHYLFVDDLLTLQRPLTEGAHDELLFIVVHQSYELWFKLLLHELRAAVASLEGGGAVAALAPLERVRRVDDLLLHHLDVLETLTPDGFLQFRDPLTPASGFQSVQFRELERIGGGTAEGDLWPSYCAAARAAGLDMPPPDQPATAERRLATLVDLYREHAEPARGTLHRVAELLLDHDERLSVWRFRHALMAEREIGSRTGTGGSPGVGYLRSTVDSRLMPELWQVRSLL